MDQSKYITIEFNFRFQMQDYRLVLGVKRMWIVALIFLAARLAPWLRVLKRQTRSQ